MHSFVLASSTELIIYGVALTVAEKLRPKPNFHTQTKIYILKSQVAYAYILTCSQSGPNK